MSKIKKRKKKNYTLKKKRYPKRGGSSAVQPEVVEAEVVEAEIVQPNQVVSTELVPQNEKAMESRQPNTTTENKNGNSDDDSDRALLIFHLDVNETCPTTYKLLKKKKKSFCYKLSSKSNLIQNYNNQTPLENDVTAEEKKILDSNIESLKQDQKRLLFFKKTEEELTEKKKTGEKLTTEEQINLEEGKAKRKTIENTMRNKMKKIIKKEGPGALRRMTAGGLAMAVTLLLFPALGIVAPGVGSSVYKVFDTGFKKMGNTVYQRRNKWKTEKNKKKNGYTPNNITQKKNATISVDTEEVNIPEVIDVSIESGNKTPMANTSINKKQVKQPLQMVASNVQEIKE